MKNVSLLACVFFVLGCLPASAIIIGVETFDYPNGPLAGQTGGTFWDYKNTAPAGRSGTASSWSNLSGAPDVTSGQLVTSGNGTVKRAYNGNTEADGAINDANVAKTVYYRVNVTTGPSVTAGDYFGISSMDGGTEKFYFGKRGNFVNWGVEEVGVAASDGNLDARPNTTYTLVVQVDLPGDKIRLYVDPNLRAEQSANTPTASLTYNGTAASTAVRFAAGTAVRWDNLVIATTWEELQVTVVTTLADEDNGTLGGGTGVSLREAVKYSPTGSLITFAPGLSGKTIFLNGTQMEVPTGRSLTVDASALPNGITLDGNNASRHFQVQSGRSLTLRGLTLTGGNSGDDDGDGDGGSINNNRGTLLLTQCTFSGNVSQRGGAIRNDGTAVLTHCTFTGNSARYGGAVLTNGSSPQTTLFHCTFTGNRAIGTLSIHGGGAIDHYRGSLTMTGCILAGNTAASGIGPDFWKESTLTSATKCLIGDGADSTLTNGVDGNLVGTTAAPIDAKLSPLGYFGGPVQTMHPLIGSPAIDAAGSTNPGGTDARGFPRFVDGSDTVSGTQLDIGAVEAGPALLVTLATDFGSGGNLRTRIANAGIFNEPGVRIVFDPAVFPASTITLNSNQLTPPAGKAIFIDASNLSGPVTLSAGGNSRVFNIPATTTLAMHSVRIVNGNPGSANGGGILNEGTCTMMLSVLSGNLTNLGGCGIYNNGTCKLISTSLSANTCSGNGAGIFNNGTCSVISSTVSGNKCSGNGGGILNNGTCNVISTTIAENDSGRGSGIYNAGGICTVISSTLSSNFGSGITNESTATMTVQSSIVAGNEVENTDDDFSGISGNNFLSGDPLLLPLGDYGGPTQTMALLPGSLARGAGGASARTPDQRGFPIVGTPDIGAYEAQIGPIEDVNLIENAAAPTRNFSVGQIGTLTASSTNTTLVPVGNIVITGTGASRSITAMPAQSQFGSAVITLTEDLHGETQTFTLTVNPVAGTVVSITADGGPGSLRAAFDSARAAAGPNTITFAPGFTGPITLSSEILMNDVHPVVVDASSVSGGLVLNAGPNSRHFQVPAGMALTLRGLTLQGGNAGGDGGSIYNEGAVILERCTLINNRSNFGGGAVDSRGPLFRAVDCSFSENTSKVEGGGIRCRGAVAELTRCTISGNGSCGLVLFSSVLVPQVTVTLTQCTVVNNTNLGSSATGGIRALSGTLNLIHCTISGNSSTFGSGGLFISETTVTTTNCIIAGNTSTVGAPPDISLTVSGTLTPRGANLIGSNQSVEASFPAGPLVGTASAPLDPVLESLNLYAGSTSTMPPRPGSPALDQASVLSPALTTDQSGQARPLGIRPDLGAVEASIIVVTTPVDELDAPGSPGNGVSLREAVRDVPANGRIDFDRAIFGGAAAYTLTLSQGPLNPQRNGFLFNTANPNGIRIGYVATITQQPQSQSVATGATASFSVGVANLSGGVDYNWRKNGFGEGIGSTLNLSNVQESNEGVYDVMLSEAFSVGNIVPANLVIFPVSITPFSGISQPASLIVNGAPVTVQRHPVEAMIALGSSHTLSVVAVGPPTPALTYQWFKAGKVIAGATKSSYLIPKAALTHAGAYTCVVKSGTTSVTSTTAEIGVVDTTPKTVNLTSGGTFTPVVNAAGNGLQPFVWKRDATVLAPTAKTFTLKPVTVGDAGLYTCTVTGLAGTITTGCNTRLTVSDAAPQIIEPLILPAATIGQTYFYQIPIASVVGAPATAFTVTGLPPGMTWDKLTGIISGRPTASTKPLGYPLTIKASNPKSSDTATANLLVNIVPPNAVGVFAGPLERSPLNDNLGGRFDLTTTATGLCSGSVTLGARAKLSFTNQLLLSSGVSDAILRVNIPGLTMADKTPLTAYLEVFATDQTARLTLVHPNSTTLLATAWRNSWSRTRLATAYAATYTARLDPANSGNPPRGYGFATLIVKPDGTLTLTGKLPDGSGLTQAGFVGPEGQLTVFNLLNVKRGSLVGPLQIIPETPVANNALGGTLDWLKLGPLPRSADTVYQAGFGPLNVAVEGSPYIAPAKGQRVMGLGTTPNPNAKLDFTLGGLVSDFTQLLHITNPSATGLTNKGTLTLPLTNTTKLTTLDAAKGQFKGSFVINGATVALNRPAPFEGQIVKIGATTQGYGFFLLPSVPTGTQRVTTSPKQSGRVVLAVP